MTTEEYFEKQILEENASSDHYEKIRLNIFNVLEDFSKNLYWFDSLSKAKKYELCYLTVLIGVHTNLQQLNNTTILFTKPIIFYKHSIDRPNKKYEIISLDSEELKSKPKIIQIDYDNNT